jgi:two-component system, NarL family, nitrate/nitrite response regulator NarL
MYCAARCPSVGCLIEAPPAPAPRSLSEVHMQKRILIVDDSALIRGLVRTFIECRPGLEVCGEAADGLEGVEKCLELKPDLIVLDFAMPRINGLQTALMLHEVAPTSPIILFTFFKDAVPIHMARAAGVASIVSKGDLLTVLADEVQRLTDWVN